MTESIPPATRFVPLPSPFAFKRGGALHGARMAFETWGTLGAARDNAVLILTGLSPNAHAATSEANPEAGWWEAMVGPGKPIDSERCTRIEARPAITSPAPYSARSNQSIERPR